MQLDLFTRRKGPAVVFRFPLARRADLVRATASELRGRSYEDGKRYWIAQIQKFRREFKASGLSRSEIDQELSAYSRAVSAAVYAAQPGRMTR